MLLEAQPQVVQRQQGQSCRVSPQVQWVGPGAWEGLLGAAQEWVSAVGPPRRRPPRSPVPVPQGTVM